MIVNLKNIQNTIGTKDYINHGFKVKGYLRGNLPNPLPSEILLEYLKEFIQD